ncbi:MAG: DoxX family protein [Flavobacteriales bacterium]
MKKRNLIIYWIVTLWLCLGMLSTGIVQLLGTAGETEMMQRLGYPPYVLILIGAWKILGVTAVLLPRLPLLKEWAYAGFFFVLSGAVFSHIAAGDPFTESLPPLLLLLLTSLSWYFRPATRRIQRVPVSI